MALALAVVLVWPGWIPFPRPTTGTASWYVDGSGLYAAIRGFRGKPFYVIVRTATAKVRVLVRDGCGCLWGTPSARIIDLSPAAFSRLAPLGRGLVKVTVTKEEK